jgi:hypothetical protein
MADVMRRIWSQPKLRGQTRLRTTPTFGGPGIAAMRPFSRGGLYLNFAGFGEEKEAMLRDAYGSNYDQLLAIKTQYDHGNLFRMNLNIPPTGAASSV